jgi:hypothetical protein
MWSEGDMDEVSRCEGCDRTPAGILHEDEADFMNEVERRAERVRSDESEGLDWDEVVRELLAK